MKWVGKIIGFMIGWMLLGPLGGVVGFVLGHVYDIGMLGRWLSLSGIATGENTKTTFFNSSFSVLGYLAKSDGRVTRKEIQVAESLMLRFRLSDGMRRRAINQFNLGKRPDFDIEAVIATLKKTCMFNPSLLRTFVEIQVELVFADGVLLPQKRAALLHVFALLGLSESVFNQFERQYQAGRDYKRHSAGPERDPSKQLRDAYVLLGTTASANDSDVKKAYRKMMSKHHPDKLIAKGVPEEMVKVATQKTQQVKQAYETIKKARNL